MKLHRWDHIYAIIKDIKFPIGAEIGVHRGECSSNLLRLHPGLTLYMIDAWSSDSYAGKGDDAAGPESRRIYQEQSDDNFKAALASVIAYDKRKRIYQMPSKLAAVGFPDGFFDFVFVDAAHDEESVYEDSWLWTLKIKKGGFICGHDIDNPDFPGVRKAVERMFGLDRIEIEPSDYMWFVRL